jgi:hypothetical protein
MAGTGANTVLDKALPVLATYNSSAAAGVLANRFVKFGATAGTIDLNAATTTRSIGVVMENIDATKVATGKATADVRMMGIATVIVTTATSIVLGSLVMSSSTGGAVLAATTGNIPLGVVVGITGTITAGDLIQVLLTPGLPAIP